MTELFAEQVLGKLTNCRFGAKLFVFGKFFDNASPGFFCFWL